MGIGGIGIWQLLIVLLIVVLLFGTKRLRNIGQDMGSAVRSFRSAVKTSEQDDDETSEQLPSDDHQADANFESSADKDQQKPRK